jgi:hypothetical protein
LRESKYTYSPFLSSPSHLSRPAHGLSPAAAQPNCHCLSSSLSQPVHAHEPLDEMPTRAPNRAEPCAAQSRLPVHRASRQGRATTSRESRRETRHGVTLHHCRPVAVLSPGKPLSHVSPSLSRVASPPPHASPPYSPTAPNPGHSRRRPCVTHVSPPFPLSARPSLHIASPPVPDAKPSRRRPFLSENPAEAASPIPPVLPRPSCQLAAASRQAAPAIKGGPSPFHPTPLPSLSLISLFLSFFSPCRHSGRRAPPLGATDAGRTSPDFAAAFPGRWPPRRASPPRHASGRAEQNARTRKKTPSSR